MNTKLFAAVIVATLLVDSLCDLAHSSDSPARNSKPNIVIILVDDMGYGDPGCFNPDSKISTPNIDQLAKSGMKFIDAHAPGPLCHMSRYGLMTGRYPFRTNVGLWPKKPLIAPEQLTIASLAQSNGYRTAMVGKWHLGFDESKGYEQALPGGPADRGFDAYFGIRASTDIPPYFYIRDRQATKIPSNRIEKNNTKGWSPIQGAFWRAGGIAPDLKLEEVTPRFTSEAIAAIENHKKEHADKPLMLYLAYPSPHTPWLPSKEFNGKSKAGLYGDFTEMVDDEIGKVLTALKRSKMADNTLLIFTADNGPVWYKNDVKKFGHDSAGGLRGMKADAWEAGHRMPFIVRWPNTVKPNTTSRQTICFTDLLTTFADVFDVKLNPEDGPDSFSFLSVLKGDQPQSKPIRGPIVMSPGRGKPMMMIRSGNWKLIKGRGSGGFSKPNLVKPKKGEPKGQLYNLKTDLSESTNVYADQPDRVRSLLSKMESIISAPSSREIWKQSEK